MLFVRCTTGFFETWDAVGVVLDELDDEADCGVLTAAVLVAAATAGCRPFDPASRLSISFFHLLMSSLATADVASSCLMDFRRALTVNPIRVFVRISKLMGSFPSADSSSCAAAASCRRT